MCVCVFVVFICVVFAFLCVCVCVVCAVQLLVLFVVYLLVSFVFVCLCVCVYVFSSLFCPEARGMRRTGVCKTKVIMSSLKHRSALEERRPLVSDPHTLQGPLGDTPEIRNKMSPGPCKDRAGAAYGRAPICLLGKRDHRIGVCTGYASGMHRGTHQAIALYVKLDEGGFGARPTSLAEETSAIPVSVKKTLLQKKQLPEKKTLWKTSFKTPNRGLERIHCCRSAGQRPASKECVCSQPPVARLGPLSVIR